MSAFEALRDVDRMLAGPRTLNCDEPLADIAGARERIRAELDGLLVYRLLRCQRCGNRDWIVGDTAPDCTSCGTRNLWEEVQTFFARSQGPGLAPVPVSGVAA